MKAGGKVRRRRLLAIPLLVLLGLVAVVAGRADIPRGAGDPSEAPATQPAGRLLFDTTGLALRVGLSLAFIMILILTTTYVLRLLGGRAGTEGHGAVRVLGKCYLAPKRAIYTIEVGEQVLLVGVTETSITPVLELSPEHSREMRAAASARRQEPTAFSGILKSISGKIAGQRT